MFAELDGSAIPPDHISQAFVRATKRSGLPRVRLHDLRHGHASILLQAGQPIRVVSERLGHFSPALTLSVYAHVLPGAGAEAAEAFGALAEGGQ